MNKKSNKIINDLTRKCKSMSEQQELPFFQRAISMIRQIPSGKVATYGQISILISNSVRGARAVGYALAGLKGEEAQEVPWWRVMNAQGRISNPKGRPRAALQQQLLEDEGVIFEDGRVDLDKFGWEGA